MEDRGSKRGREEESSAEPPAVGAPPAPPPPERYIRIGEGRITLREAEGQAPAGQKRAAQFAAERKKFVDLLASTESTRIATQNIEAHEDMPGLVVYEAYAPFQLLKVDLLLGKDHVTSYYSGKPINVDRTTTTTRRRRGERPPLEDDHSFQITSKYYMPYGSSEGTTWEATPFQMTHKALVVLGHIEVLVWHERYGARYVRSMQRAMCAAESERSMLLAEQVHADFVRHIVAGHDGWHMLETHAKMVSPDPTAPPMPLPTEAEQVNHFLVSDETRDRWKKGWPLDERHYRPGGGYPIGWLPPVIGSLAGGDGVTHAYWETPALRVRFFALRTQMRGNPTFNLTTVDIDKKYRIATFVEFQRWYARAEAGSHQVWWGREFALEAETQDRRVDELLNGRPMSQRHPDDDGPLLRLVVSRRAGADDTLPGLHSALADALVPFLVALGRTFWRAIEIVAGALDVHAQLESPMADGWWIFEERAVFEPYTRPGGTDRRRVLWIPSPVAPLVGGVWAHRTDEQRPTTLAATPPPTKRQRRDAPRRPPSPDLGSERRPAPPPALLPSSPAPPPALLPSSPARPARSPPPSLRINFATLAVREAKRRLDALAAALSASRTPLQDLVAVYEQQSALLETLRKTGTAQFEVSVLTEMLSKIRSKLADTAPREVINELVARARKRASVQPPDPTEMQRRHDQQQEDLRRDEAFAKQGRERNPVPRVEEVLAELARTPMSDQVQAAADWRERLSARAKKLMEQIQQAKDDDWLKDQLARDEKEFAAVMELDRKIQSWLRAHTKAQRPSSPDAMDLDDPAAIMTVRIEYANTSPHTVFDHAVTPWERVEEVKDEIAARMGLRSNHFELVVDGVQLKNERTIGSYDIQAGTVITLYFPGQVMMQADDWEKERGDLVLIGVESDAEDDDDSVLRHCVHCQRISEFQSMVTEPRGHYVYCNRTCYMEAAARCD